LSTAAGRLHQSLELSSSRDLSEEEALALADRHSSAAWVSDDCGRTAEPGPSYAI
jgi:hypothetical protein